MDPSDCPPVPVGPGHAQEQHLARLDIVSRRIVDKLDNYKAYNFTQLQSVALNIFFDLAQEFTKVEDVYALCVMIPKTLFNLECTLYVIDGQNDVLSCCASHCPAHDGEIRFAQEPVVKEGHLRIPIKGNRELLSQLPFKPQGDSIGMLEIFPADTLTEHDRLFWGRYANRIGFQLHNRFISLKNKEHVQFIRNLVKDIGHNVIVPNMFFKLFYKRLEARIGLIRSYQEKFHGLMEHCLKLDKSLALDFSRLEQDVEYFYNAILNQYKEIFSHYQNTSLFLETLLRSSHFEAGRYVLEKRKCNFKSQVIDPQVERYRARLEERGIEIDTSMGGVPDQEIEVVADMGLISQVYANLFSNVVKYTREVDDGTGRKRKFMSYGWQVLKNHFAPGRDGIKFNVFSSGQPIAPVQAGQLFSEGFRGENSQGEHGTGHGLYFIREVVALHGGESGYEPTPQGNNFYFVLPVRPHSGDDFRND
ncbi:Non-motile and phage-resistance protein [Fundidesulfovibrio magnetotacticus]|uniref:histidine kinase n=1 Tax=Fundidesulfovibrio magnetotacticus TaxID=2730080 RepID=A0A6V8LZL9_9BACT|nr:ATP-binding protein [Fundidesulfovibrio magnetotacticus]GFK95668.1 Non-motile and phage-resistance protein [Fundidesulfovibrio magnetotacticus]